MGGTFMEQFLGGMRAGQAQRQQKEDRERDLDLHELRIKALKQQMDDAKLEKEFKIRNLTRDDILNTPVGRGAGGVSPGMNAQQPQGQVPMAPLGPSAGQLAQPEQRLEPNIATPGYEPRTLPGVPSAGVPDQEVIPAILQQMLMQRRAQEVAMHPSVVAAGVGAQSRENIAAMRPPPQERAPTAYGDLTSGDPAKMGRAKTALEILKPPKAGGGSGGGAKKLTPNQLLLFPTLKMGATIDDAEGLEPTRPASPAVVDRNNRLNAIEGQLKAIEKEFKPEWVGGVMAGGGGTVFGRLKEASGRISTEESDFRTRTVRTLSEELNRLSGAAISPAEYTRLEKAMPNVGMAAPAFKSALKISLEIIKELKGKYADGGVGSGGGDPLELFK